jgi:small conductance mechanosensitive channel
VGRQAFADERLHRLLLDAPSVMGVESLSLEEVNVRIVARTLPGKQFEVSRDLRARVALALSREGVSLRASAPGVEDEALAEDRARTGGRA